MKNEIKLVPSYWASVSGGKDSLYMLNMILNNLDKYPLNGVVHFELEIDYPFIKKVVDFMENRCKKNNIPFYRIKPRKTWEELYNKYNYPTRVARWCNSKYKLDCNKQFKDFMKDKGYDVYYYIGYCVDEHKRYEHRKLNEIYPLVENDILECNILEWAKKQDIFNDYYKINKRCGCMGCPMSSLINWAYLKVYYPDKYNYFLDKIKKSDIELSKKLNKQYYTFGRMSADDLENKMINKYVPLLTNTLNDMNKYHQITLDLLEND